MGINKNNEIENKMPLSEEELAARVDAVYKERVASVDKKQKRRLTSTIISIAVEVIVALVLVVSIFSAASGEAIWFFNRSFSIVATSSMSGEIEAGDFIIIEKCEIESVTEGENIVFIAGASFGKIQGNLVCHKAVKIENVDGKIEITTKGVNAATNPKNDDEAVTAENFVGKCVFVSTFIGKVHAFLTDIVNWVFIVVGGVFIWFVFRQLRKFRSNSDKEKKAVTPQGEPSKDSPPATKSED